MKSKIDLKFVIGLVVGALVMGGVAFLVIGLTGGDDGDKTKNTSANGNNPGTAPTSDVNGDDEGGDGGDDGGKGGGAQPGQPLALPVPEGAGKINCPNPTKTVTDAKSLEQAVNGAKPGDVIKMNAGTYSGKFVAQASGTAQQPIFLCGDQGAIIDGGGPKKGYAFHLNKANFWRLIGFTVQNSQKGVMADTSNGSIIQGLTVHDIGDEAIHLRNFSTGNTVQYNKIYNTGLRREKFGEGVYLGTAQSNWKKFSGGRIDNSDNNVVRGNVIRATAEAIDIKEGTTGGKIIGNVFDGSVTGGDKHNDSWVDVKGNNYVLEGNKGTKTPADGFQVHKILDGWGKGNVFRGNTIDLAGGKGVGINDTVGGNTIACDNKVTGGQLVAKGQCSG
ncbi:right-handed parallel beta-helix repeat-containing protein [Actinomadura barringtoniae]|uniref:Right-handed parallel beta-helix repeat-containing protein n=1 Tax=Actinomadura barringtoniae TaxID=1427535 RepID=A0A939PG13_9ACTN|nr:right-handed parallel beta-helix repeat-containing protein [Actinomadura barringtoniae]MBO2449069.1 right-handed parallel beta-helix repeat-containing protein [Actinomadura barringtoniae]